MTAWLTAIGYSLCYGTIITKMFRVFYIFRNPTMKKRVVSYSELVHLKIFNYHHLQKLHDWMLALIVLMFIAIDVIILLVYDVHSATQDTLEAIRLSNRERMREEIGVRDLNFLNTM